MPNRFEDAVPWFEAALALSPEEVEVSTDLGVAYYYMDDTDRALSQFARSLDVAPAHAKTILNLGIVRAFGKQDLEGAIEAWEEVQRVAPGSPEAFAAADAIELIRAATSLVALYKWPRQATNTRARPVSSTHGVWLAHPGSRRDAAGAAGLEVSRRCGRGCRAPASDASRKGSTVGAGPGVRYLRRPAAGPDAPPEGGDALLLLQRTAVRCSSRNREPEPEARCRSRNGSAPTSSRSGGRLHERRLRRVE